MVRNLFHRLDAGEDSERYGRGRGIGSILPGEDNIIGSEWLAVVPGNAGLQFPDDPLAGGIERSFLNAGQLRCKSWDEVGVFVQVDEVLVEDRAGIDVLLAVGQ